MGLPGCNCRVDFDATGTIPLGFASLAFDVDIDICPECGLENSTASASIVVTLFGQTVLNASFVGTPSGLPVCEDGELEVVVVGTFTLGGNAIPNVALTLNLNANEGEICITLPEEIVDQLPSFVPNPICLPVEGLTIIDCPEVG